MGLKFKNRKGLDKYTNVMKKHIPDRETAICEEENKVYIWHKGWQEFSITTDEPLVEMSLYEMNQQLIAQMPDHEGEQLQADIILINQYDDKTKAKYYMLLCKEYNYYTIFNYYKTWADSAPTLGKIVRECLENVGTIRACDYDNIDNPTAIEIWVHTNEDETHCFHLFPYDEGVVDFTRGD